MYQIPTTTSLSNEYGIFMAARHTYCPTGFRSANGPAWGIRRKVWRFKDGDAVECADTAVWVRDTLRVNIANLEDCALVCIPAATRESTEQRYGFFARLVCRLTGMSNGNEHISILADRLAYRNHKLSKSLMLPSLIKLSPRYFRNRRVVIFDDVITKGATLKLVHGLLTEAGAHVEAALFLAKTITS